MFFDKLLPFSRKKQKLSDKLYINPAIDVIPTCEPNYYKNKFFTAHAINKDLDVIYNGTLPKRKEEIIARDILNTAGVCTSKSICPQARRYLSQSPSRIDCCKYGAQLLIPPQNNNELYLVAKAYYYAGASCRIEAIKWLSEYIKNGAISDYICSYNMQLPSGIIVNQREKFIALAHIDLADLYEREYQFNNALIHMQTSLAIAPYMPMAYVQIPNVYVKLNDYDNALEFIEKSKHSIEFSTFPEIRQMILQAEKNILEKKNRGYVYKPRPRK